MRDKNGTVTTVSGWSKQVHWHLDQGVKKKKSVRVHCFVRHINQKKTTKTEIDLKSEISV